MRFPAIIISLLVSFLLISCKEEKDAFTTESEPLNIKTNVIDKEKAKKFDEKFNVLIPYQEFGFVVKMQMASIGVDTTVEHGSESYLVFSKANGQAEKTYTLARDTAIRKGEFILWYQPLNFKDDQILYFHNNHLIERNAAFDLVNKYTGKLKFSFDPHNIEDAGDGYLYTADVFGNKKEINGKNVTIVDFQFFKVNKETGEKTNLFTSSETVADTMLVPELFESPEKSPLYKDYDIYHWNWLQLEGEKMYISNAFCGLQKIDIPTKKVIWHWGYKHHTFSKITGVGDLSGPYYTHHFNKIESGPHKGRYSYFENGSEPIDGNEYKPARARIFEIDTVQNSINIVWEKVYDFASSALGSMNVFDDYILVNVGLAIPLRNMQDIYKAKGKKAAVDYYYNLNRPLLYLYDSNGYAISEYVYKPGFYTYIASPIKKR